GPDGRIYVLGGMGSSGALADVVAYSPATNTWSAAGRMQLTRVNAAATALSNGHIYAVGGQTTPSFVSVETLDTRGSDFQNYVGQLYQDILGRPADGSGLQHFSAVLDGSAAARRGVALSLLRSSEYRTNLIKGLYLQLLGRPVDPAGLASW